MTQSPAIGYVGAHLPSYYAREYRVFERSRDGLERLAGDLGFTLHAAAEPVVTRADAERAAAELEAAGVDLVLLQNATFAMGDVALAFAGRRFRLGLWAVPEPTREGPIMLNNFVSMNLQAGILVNYLRARRQPFKWFYGDVDHAWFAPRLEVSVRALRALKRLERGRIGQVGGLAPTFYNLAFDERRLADRLGLEVQAHELDELIEPARRAEPAEVGRVVEALRAAARGRVEVADDHMATSAGLYLAMRAFAAEHGYDALAVSDWPRFQEALGVHPGMAFSWLDEHDRIPVASEGDVLGAATMLLMAEAGAGPALLLDMNDLDPERQAVLMWHCGGSPLGLADEAGVRWVDHSTLGRKVPGSSPMGAVADLRFRRGPVTVARLLADGTALLALEAEVVDSVHPGYDGSRGWVGGFRFDGAPLTLADLVNTVMVEGIDHHFVLGSGHRGEALLELAAWRGIRVVRPAPYRDRLQLGSRAGPEG